MYFNAILRRRPGRCEQVLDIAGRPGRRVDVEWRRSVVELPRLEKAGEAENVITVEVREEDRGDIEAGGEPHHLTLRTFPNVEEESFPFSAK